MSYAYKQAYKKQKQQASMPMKLTRYVSPRKQHGRQIVSIRRTNVFGTVSFSSSDVLSAYSFRFFDIQDYLSLTATYDQYRITKMTVKFMPSSYGSINTSAGANYSNGYIATAIDNDDATVTANMGELLAYDNAKVTPPGVTHVRTFKVNPQVTAGGFIMNNPWIDTTVNATLHYGIKFGLQAVTGYLTYPFVTPVATYHLQFRASR